MGLLKDFALAFIPLFVAVDVVGVLPISASWTAGMEQMRRNKVIRESMITAACLAAGSVFVGKLVFRLLGITMGDFMIAGGAILFCLALIDTVSSAKKRRMPTDSIGAVPLGTPLIAGPAVLTTSMVLVAQFGVVATLLAVVSNILAAGLVLRLSSRLMSLLGEIGSKALSKVVSLLLAAIAVMLIRKGFEQLLAGHQVACVCGADLEGCG